MAAAKGAKKAKRQASANPSSSPPEARHVPSVGEEVGHVLEVASARHPWRSPMLYVGLAMLAVGLAAYLWLFIVNRTQGIAVAVACGTLFAAGKEAGIPAGRAVGGNVFLIGAALLWLDSAMSFVIYPFVDAAMRGAQKQKGVIGHMVRGARRRADRKREIVDKYGGVGLFAFMIVPFGFNGPLIGMVIGRLVGLGARVIMVAVMAAIVTTTTAWVLLWTYGLGDVLSGMPSWVPAVLAMTIAAIAITSSIMAGKREKKREEDELAAKGQ